MWEQKESNLPSMQIMRFTVPRLTNSSITPIVLLYYKSTKRSWQLSNYLFSGGLGRLRSYYLRVNSSLLYQLSYKSMCGIIKIRTWIKWVSVICANHSTIIPCAEDGGNDPPWVLSQPSFSSAADYLSRDLPIFWGSSAVSNRVIMLHKHVLHLKASRPILKNKHYYQDQSLFAYAGNYSCSY